MSAGRRKKLLIIGGNRFVGAELVSRAVLEGHEVTVAALDPPNVRARNHVRFVRVDRNSKEELETALRNQTFDAVLDNIAFAPEHVELLIDVLRGRIGRYVLTSTVDIYPRGVCRVNSEHHEQLSPSDTADAPRGERYFRGKRACEKILRESAVSWAVIRPAIVFGRADPIPPAPRSLRPAGSRWGRSLFFPCRVADGGPILLRRKDRRAFSLAGAQDVARALVLVAVHPDADGRAFNVAGDEIWTSERLVRALGAAAGKKNLIVRVDDEELEAAGLGDYDSPYGRLEWWSAVDNRALKSLGWGPTPAGVQFAKLMEAVPPPAKRPFYDRRSREIALARTILHRRAAGARRSVITVRPGDGKPVSAPQSAAERTCFSPEGSALWREGLVRTGGGAPLPHPDHFRSFLGSTVTSIGIGTHRGEPDDATDALYLEALLCAVRGGINLIDTAINYRWMRAERTVGKALAQLEVEGTGRESVCLCTKGGFVPQDRDDPRPLDRFIEEEFLAPGLIEPEEARRRHSIRPGFIARLLEMSLANLGVEHIDLYYLHNPERALEWMGEKIFYSTLRETFGMLEERVEQGRISAYGVATWQGLRARRTDKQYLSLARIHRAAREAGGPDHHFRAIQFPLNVANLQPLRRKNQEVEGRMMTLLEAAAALDLYTCTSASIQRGEAPSPAVRAALKRAAGNDLDPLQSALQFVRSVPGVGTSLVGMRRREYVEKALVVASHPVTARDSVEALIREISR
ncbi:MAG: hypothetical protein Kow0089_18280 [Desulfobulbaceae bacterium]